MDDPFKREVVFLFNQIAIKTKLQAILLAIVAWLFALWLLTPYTASESPKEPSEPLSYSDQFISSYGSNLSDIEQIIISKAIAESISPELLLKIAKCESGLKPDAKNSTSTASGLFQFINSTFFNYAQAYELPTDNKNDPEVQAELAAKMISDGGLHHWNASRSCWQ